MPRKPEQPAEGENNPEDFELAQKPDEEPEPEPGAGPEPQVSTEELGEVAENREPPAENERAPRPKRDAKEKKAMADGKVPWMRIHAKRLAPNKIRHPSTGMPIACDGQTQVFQGQYTRAEIEDLIHDYFGGGAIRVTAFNTEDNNKILNQVIYKFPGDPKMENVLADCMTQDQALMVASASSGRPSPVPGSAPLPLPGMPPVPGYPQAPEDPVKKVEQEANLMEAEARKEEVMAEIQERKVELESRKAAARRRLRDMRTKEELHEEGEFTFSGSERPPFRPGLGPSRPSYRGYEPLDEMDRPISHKDMLHEREMAELREHNRRLEERLERLVEKSHEPKKDITDTIAAITAAAAPILSEVLKLNASQRESERQSQETLLKLVVGDSGKSDKTMALIIQALGVQDQRESNKFRDFSEMARLVSDLSDGKGGGGIVSDIAEGLGQVAQGITGAIMAAKQSPPPQHVFVQPPQPPLLPGQVSPPPGAAIQAMPGIAQPALPAPQRVVSIPQAPAVQEQPSGEDEVTDEDLKGLAAHVLSLALQECDAKPAQAAWVKAIFDGLPNEWVEMVAEAKNYTELADLVKPYATSSMDRLVPLILKIKGDPGVRPWLEAGFVQLQAMCRRERGAPAPPPPAAAVEPASPAVAASEETEPAEDDSGGEFGEEA